MSSKYLIGLDAGGGSGRCLLLDVESNRVISTFRRWWHTPAPGTGGWGFDLDLERCWSLLAEAVREALDRAGASPDDVVGVAATSMRHTTVVVDKDGSVLLATPNRDARATSEGMGLVPELGEELYRRTGHWPSPIFAAARLRWMKENSPAGEGATFLSLSDWIAYRLCGELAAEPSQAGETLLFDLQQGDWAWDLIERIGLSRSLFPKVRKVGERLGGLGAEAAAALGLKAGTPVAVGGADTQLGLLGTGITAPEAVAAVAGTTTPVQMTLDRPVMDSQYRTWTGCYVLPGVWVLESNAGSTGEALEWFAGVLCPEAANPAACLSAEATRSIPGAAGIFSTVGADIMNARNMGLPVSNLTFSHMASPNDPARRGHMARAVLEGMAYSLRANIEQVSEVSGVDLSELRVAGGMANSSLWLQILSEVLNVPVRAPVTPESSGLGAAVCAGAGAGLFSLAQGAEQVALGEQVHTPDEKQARAYQGFYSEWNNLREARSGADEVAGGIFIQSLMDQPAETVTVPTFRPRIYVTADLGEESLAKLRALGEVEYASHREEMRLLTGPDLVEELTGYHVLVTEVDIVDLEALRELPDLRVVFSCRGNVVNVDIPACTALGIPVVNTPGRNADAVADLTVAFVLMLARKLPGAMTFLLEPGGEAGDMGRMARAYDAFRGQELWGSTVGLVGLGAVGQMVARRLAPFGARVLASDPFVNPDEAALAGVELVSLETLLEQSDFVSLHAAVTDGTRGMIGGDQLGHMKRGAYLVNTARAALVDGQALVDALSSGHLGGAALDVFDVEPPPPDHPLLQLPNVISTPHVGGNTHQVAVHQGYMVAEDLRRLLTGQRPLHALNPETLPRFTWEGERLEASAEELAELSEGPAPAVTDLDQTPKVVSEPRSVERPASQPAPQPPAQEGGLKGGLSRLRDRLRGKTSDQPAGAPAQVSTAGAAAGMERVLQAFAARISQDEALADFAAGRQMTMLFTLSDVDIDFYMLFDEGRVDAGLGMPPGEPQVRLKMTADVMDGMFTGRINAMRAAMGGKLSFSGDTKLAMGFQRIQSDLGRLYSAASEETGGPGDLSSIAPPTPAAPAAAPTPDRPAAPAKVGDERDELLAVLNELYSVGCITATGGNLSVRIPGTDELWITPSQVFKGDLHPGVMVRLNLTGKVMDPDALSPSSEWPMHCAIFRARPDVEAVIHTHAPYATMLALTELPFLPISTEAAFMDDLPRVPFIMPGTNELAQAVVEYLADGPAVLLQNHGLLVASGSLRRGANLTEVIERTSEVILGCYAVGKEPPVLPQDVVATLREMGKMMG